MDAPKSRAIRGSVHVCLAMWRWRSAHLQREQDRVQSPEHRPPSPHDRFDDPDMPGKMPVTVTLRQVACGTEREIVQEGIPAAIPVELCYLGWQESLVLLAQLVEPEIPDGA